MSKQELIRKILNSATNGTQSEAEEAIDEYVKASSISLIKSINENYYTLANGWAVREPLDFHKVFTSEQLYDTIKVLP